MKSIITSLFIALSISLSAQSYIPINTQDTTGVWSVWEDKIFFRGDSLLNGQVYKKIWKNEKSAVVDFQDQSHFLGLFREDTATKKSWLVHPNKPERLIMDLSLTIGDTIKVYPLESPNVDFTFMQNLNLIKPDSGFVLEVKEINFDTIAGVARKIFRLNRLPFVDVGNNDELWIEGIGSSAGLVYSGLGIHATIHGPWEELLCYQELQNQLYFSPLSLNGSVCNRPMIVSVNEIEAQASLKIFPNPNQGRFTVELADFGGNITLYLYDITGRVVQETSQALEAGKTELQLKPLAAGTYFLQVKTQERLFVKKIIIQP